MRVLPVARQVFRAFIAHQGWLLAAAIAYYTLLSVFPLVLGLVAVLGAFLSDPTAQAEFVAAIAGLFPGSGPLIQETVGQVVAGSGTAGFVATIGLILAATGVFVGVSQSLDIVWEAPRTRSVLGATLLAVALVLAVGLIFVVSLVLSAVARVVQNASVPGAPGTLATISLVVRVVDLIAPFVLAFGVFAGIYKFVPNVHLRWEQVWPGALFASVLFELSKQIFGWFLATFANYNAVYGSIAAVIALVTWAFVVAIILILGAELNAVLHPLDRHRGQIPLAEQITR
jgi:membrane protein